MAGEMYANDNSRLFALGRNAIYAACRILQLKEGDEILTPAFDCDGTLQPFKALRLRMSFYRSDPYTFEADIDDIKSRITSGTKLIHIINHFGMPQQWDNLSALRKESGIPILEDNAYSLFSSVNGKPFGSFGDFSIFSLRKNLPLIDGGLLRINNPDYRFTLPDKKSKWFYKYEMSGVVNIVKAALGWYKIPKSIRCLAAKFNSLVRVPPPLYSDSEKGYPKWPLRDVIGEEFLCDFLRPISKLAHLQLRKLSKKDYSIIGDKKRHYYHWLAGELQDMKGIRVLWPKLPNGIVPFSFSFLVESNRDFLLDKLQGKYDIMAWPTLPGAVLEKLSDFPEVEILGRQLLQFNLPADKVKKASFRKYLEDFVKDIKRLAHCSEAR